MRAFTGRHCKFYWDPTKQGQRKRCREQLEWMPLPWMGSRSPLTKVIFKMGWAASSRKFPKPASSTLGYGERPEFSAWCCFLQIAEGSECILSVLCWKVGPPLLLDASIPEQFCFQRTKPRSKNARRASQGGQGPLLLSQIRSLTVTTWLWPPDSATDLRLDPKVGDKTFRSLCPHL